MKLLQCTAALAVLGLAVAIPCQDNTGNTGNTGDAGVVTGAGNGPRITYEQRPDGMTEVTHHPNGSVSERILPADEVQRLRTSNALGAVSGRHLCIAMLHPQPRRLSPGQRAELKLLVTLSGNTVALPGVPYKLTLAPTDGLTFGDPVLDPPKSGTKARQYLGKPVYDDYLLFTIPVSVAASAKQDAGLVVRGNLDLDLHSGDSGVKLGTFANEVAGRVPIGPPLPEFHVDPKGDSGASGTAAKIEPGKAMAADGSGSDHPASDGIGADGIGAKAVGAKGDANSARDRAAEPKASLADPGKALADPGKVRRVPTPSGPSAGTGKGDGEATPAVSGGGSSVWVWGLGAVVFVLLVLLLLARRG